MPPLANVPGVARVAVRGISEGQNIVNVFHVAKGVPPRDEFTQLEIVALALNVGTAFKARFHTHLNVNYQAADVIATDLTSDFGRTSTAFITGGGNDSGVNVPQSAAACITWKVGRRYRGGHPRTYLGPLGSAAIANPLSLDSLFVTNLRAAAFQFFRDINDFDLLGSPKFLVALHRVVLGTVLVNPIVDLITDVTLDTRIDSQRRRLGPDR